MRPDVALDFFGGGRLQGLAGGEGGLFSFGAEQTTGLGLGETEAVGGGTGLRVGELGAVGGREVLLSSSPSEFG